MTAPKMTPAQKRVYLQAQVKGAILRYNRRMMVDAWFVVSADGTKVNKVDRWVAGRVVSFPGMKQVANSPVESDWQFQG